MGDAQIDPHIFIAHWQRFRLANLAGKHSVKVLTLALDSQGFDGPCHVSMHMQFHRANLRKVQVDSEHTFVRLWTLVLL